MEERRIDMSTNEDKTLIKFDEAKKRAVLKSIKDGYFVLQTLIDLFSKDELKKGFSETLLSLMESHVADIHKGFDYGSVLAKEKEERHSQIRAANMENRELRRQLGEKVSPEDVRECLKNMKDEIYAWWKEVGFGYVSELEFGPYIIKVKLYGRVVIERGNERERVKEIGYEVVEEEDRNICMAHSHKNIELLDNELKKRFPSSEISKIDVNFRRTQGISYINYIEVIIRNYEDVVKQVGEDA